MAKNPRKLRAMGAALMLLLTTGCASQSAAGDGDGEYAIGIVRFSSANPVETVFYDAYERAARALGYKTTSIDPNAQPDKAVAAMQTFVTKGVDLIVTGIFASEALKAGALAAKRAGIPVVTLAGGLADGIGVNLDASLEPAEEIASLMMEQTKGQGSLLVLGYSAAPSCADREIPLEEAVAGTDLGSTMERQEVTIPGQVEAGTRFAQAFLAKHPDPTDELVIWACFDDPALGAIAAIKQSGGRKNVRVYGFTGQPGALQALRDGTMEATAWPDLATAGRDLAKNTADYIKAGVEASPKNVSLPFELVTRANVDEFIKAHPEALEQ